MKLLPPVRMGGDEIILMEEEFPHFILYAFLLIKKILFGAEIDNNVVLINLR